MSQQRAGANSKKRTDIPRLSYEIALFYGNQYDNYLNRIKHLNPNLSDSERRDAAYDAWKNLFNEDEYRRGLTLLLTASQVPEGTSVAEHRAKVNQAFMNPSPMTLYSATKYVEKQRKKLYDMHNLLRKFANGGNIKDSVIKRRGNSGEGVGDITYQDYIDRRKIVEDGDRLVEKFAQYLRRRDKLEASNKKYEKRIRSRARPQTALGRGFDAMLLVNDGYKTFARIAIRQAMNSTDPAVLASNQVPTNAEEELSLLLNFGIGKRISFSNIWWIYRDLNKASLENLESTEIRGRQFRTVRADANISVLLDSPLETTGFTEGGPLSFSTVPGETVLGRTNRLAGERAQSTGKEVVPFNRNAFRLIEWTKVISGASISSKDILAAREFTSQIKFTLADGYNEDSVTLYDAFGPIGDDVEVAKILMTELHSAAANDSLVRDKGFGQTVNSQTLPRLDVESQVAARTQGKAYYERVVTTRINGARRELRIRAQNAERTARKAEREARQALKRQEAAAARAGRPAARGRPRATGEAAVPQPVIPEQSPVVRDYI